MLRIFLWVVLAIIALSVIGSLLQLAIHIVLLGIVLVVLTSLLRMALGSRKAR